MSAPQYVPNPIDTSSIRLPASLEPLLERLAQNTHDVWATQRMKDGWTHGPSRNDKRKEHPCLVPYESLTEGEKEYDRVVVAQILKAILKLGYEIAEPR
jgi:ryanodine receptor 2